MRAVVQRVLEASVVVDGKVVGEMVGPGLLVYLGVTHGDGADVSVTPTVVVRMGDRLVWHGSTGSGWMRQLAAPA